MHQLTIDHDNESLTITEHRDFDAAHRALLSYVVSSDYYLQPVQTSPAHTRYHLLHLSDPDARDPRITGSATITALPDTGLPLSAPYFAACDAQRWIAEHAISWRHGSDSDPGYRYPMAVLTIAHGEARCLLRAGTLLPEAARLAGFEGWPSLDQAAREALRQHAISSHTSPDDPAALAEAALQPLPADTGDQQAATLVWYHALIRWGVNAP